MHHPLGALVASARPAAQAASSCSQGATVTMSGFCGEWDGRVDSGPLDVTGSTERLQLDDSVGLAHVAGDDDTTSSR